MSAAILLLLAVGSESPEALIEAGRWKQARAALEPALRAAPNDPQRLWLMSRIKFSFGDMEAAEQLAVKAVALDAKKSEYHGQLAEVYGRQAQRASALRQFSLARRAKKEVEAAVSLDPHNGAALVFLVGYLTKAPGIIGGDKKRAREIATSMWNFDPPRAAIAEGIIAEDEKQWDRMKAAYRRAVDAAPDRYLAQINFVSLCQRNQFRDDALAEKHARLAMALAKGRAAAPYNILAFLYAKQQRWSELDNVLAEAVKNVPDNLAPYFNAAAAMLGDKREAVKAEAYLRKYLTQEPEANAPSHGVARWRLGVALEQKGNRDDAIRELEEAVRLQPGLDAAKRDLKRLRG